MEKHSDRDRDIYLRCGGDVHPWIGSGWVTIFVFFLGLGWIQTSNFTFSVKCQLKCSNKYTAISSSERMKFTHQRERERERERERDILSPT